MTKNKRLCTNSAWQPKFIHPTNHTIRVQSINKYFTMISPLIRNNQEAFSWLLNCIVAGLLV